MDSISNLPLLEIAAEDDSLLSDVPTAANVFSCSPLLSIRSLPRQHDAVDSANLSSSSNKENSNFNRPEAPKLSVDRQQMKRKKKGAGYNLRKSLAWDRAFFTEQGVLNPLELSMISGTATPKADLNLEAIQEEEPVATSLALQQIEENLFKHSSEGTPIGRRKNGAGVGLSPKPASLTKQTLTPASLAKRKVLAMNDVVGNTSKRSACPRSVASSSPDMAKGPSKELKVTRISGLKSNLPESTTKTARSGTLSRDSTKRNQNAHPANSIQKYSGVKGRSTNPRPVPSNPKADPANKFSVTRTLTKQAAKHLINSVSETHPPSRMQHPGSGANKSETCLPQGVSDTGEKKQQTLFQKTKSSGLRMPSPSLGYFSQVKASSSHSQLQKSSKPCNPSASSIPKVMKLQTLPHAPRKRSEIIEGAPKNCTEGLSISGVKSESSIQIDNKQMAGVEAECHSLGSEKVCKDVKVENILEHVNLKYKEQELRKSENVGSMENVVLPLHENKLLSKSHTNEQLEEETDHPLDEKLYDILSNGDQSLFQEPQSMDYNSMQRTSNNVSNTVHNAMEQVEDEENRLHACDVLTSNQNLVLLAEHEASFENSRHSVESEEYNSVKIALSNSSVTDFSETVLGGSIQIIPCKNTEQVNGGAGDFGKSGGDEQVHLLNGNVSVSCNEITQTNLDEVNQQLQGGQLKTPNPSIVGEISSKNRNESTKDSCQLVHETILSSKFSPENSSLEINGATQSESQMTEIEDCHLPVGVQSGLSLKRPGYEEYDQVIDSKAMHDETQAFELDRLSEDCRTVLTQACCTKVYVSPERRNSGESDMSISSCSPIYESQLGEDSFSRETSLHGDVPGNFEQQASMLAYPDNNEMFFEDESLVPNHGQLLHQSKFSEVSVDIISNTKDSIGNGSEFPSGFLQHTEFAQPVQEFEHTNREIDEQQASMLAYPEINVLCEDKCVVPNHDNLLLQSELSEVSVDFISNTKGSVGNGAENPSGLLQHTELAQPVHEFEHTNRKIEEKQASMLAYPEINEMLCEDGSVVPNHGHLLHQSEFSVDFISNPKDSIGNVAEKPSGLLQHAELAQSVQEFEHSKREIENQVEDAPVQFFNINSVADNCNNKYDLAVTIDQLSLAGHNNIKPIAVVGIDSQNVNNILHMDGDWLPTDIASSEETSGKNLFDGAFEGCDIHTSEHNASNHHIQATPENKDGNSHVDERSELLQINDTRKVSSDILPLVEVQLKEGDVNEYSASNHHIQATPENEDGNSDMDERAELLQINDANKGASDVLPLLEVQLNDSVLSADLEVSEDPFTKIDAWKSEDQCSLSENSKLQSSDNLTFNARIPQGSEVSSLNSKYYEDEAETNIFEKDDFPNTDMQHQIKGDINFAEDSNKIIHLQKSAIKCKQEIPAVKPPPNAVPFSDEWLAAVEAAGEEILTMKSGAVQNSPPDKPQQEPSPWSPVKRKSQAIGPFDCTKHNIQHSG